MRSGMASAPARTREWQSFHGSPIPLRNDPQEVGHDFIRALHHRLCQPLTALSCALETMQLGREADSRLTGQLQTAIAQSTRIMDLMAVFRQLFEAEVPHVGLHHTRLEPLISEVVEDLRPLAESQGVSLVFCQSGDEVFINMAGKILRQSMWNAVQNCVELSPAGAAVAIKIDGAKVTLLHPSELTDREIENTFDPFSSCTNRSKVMHVSNLPLALLQRMVVAAEGWVHAHRSMEINGRCFEIHLPLSTGSSGPAA